MDELEQLDRAELERYRDIFRKLNDFIAYDGGEIHVARVNGTFGSTVQVIPKLGYIKSWRLTKPEYVKGDSLFEAMERAAEMLK